MLVVGGFSSIFPYLLRRVSLFLCFFSIFLRPMGGRSCSYIFFPMVSSVYGCGSGALYRTRRGSRRTRPSSPISSGRASHVPRGVCEQVVILG